VDIVLRRVYHVSTGEITFEDIPDDNITIDKIKSDMLSTLYTMYTDSLNRGFISSANGGEVLYGYDSNYQLIYSKWANVLSLDSSRTSVTLGTPSGVVTLTREQFMQFMNDAEVFELNLFANRMSLEGQIKNATTTDELNGIVISL
jgi:hypothetical protein